MKWYLIVCICLMIACMGNQQQVKKRAHPAIPPIGVVADDPNLKLVNGLMYYADTLFSGHLHAFYANGTMQRMQGYYKGKEEGMLVTWFDNGQKESERYFVEGEKDSVHRGWWENGQLRLNIISQMAGMMVISENGR